MTPPPRLSRARATDLSVNQLTLTELHHEIQRRVNQLVTERDELQGRLAAIERDLETIGTLDGSILSSAGAETGRRGGGRRRGQPALRTVLIEILRDTPLSTADAADAALEAGYLTSSKNFRNSVSVVLNREPCFKKTDGRWGIDAAAVEVADPNRPEGADRDDDDADDDDAVLASIGDDANRG